MNMIKTSNNKRVVIHTGPGKTGSSAIQAWLIKNKTYLSENSVLFPDYKLSKLEISSGNMRSILSRQEETTGYGGANQAKWFVDEAKITKLLQDFNESDFSVLLLSSEFFFHHIVAIYKFIPNAEFIAYLRNPVELLESNYNQTIKRHSLVAKFKSPAKVDNFLWRYLNKVFDAIDAHNIYLRPYDRSLMVHGNIVSDLLSVIGLDKQVKDKKVNLSYTYSALEFKRLCNYFNLGALEPELDAALQACDVGDRNYSLMSAENYKRLNNESCTLMEEFIGRHNQPHLLALLQRFRDSEQKAPVSQHCDIDSLRPIVEYLQSKHRGLYDKISRLVGNHLNLVIDNTAIYEAFAKVPQKDAIEHLISDELLAHINQFTVHPSKRGKICFELACFYQKSDDLKNALMFAKGAHHFNPNNMQFVSKLNELIKLDNNSKRSTKANSSYKPRSQRFMKLKKLLSR